MKSHTPEQTKPRRSGIPRPQSLPDWLTASRLGSVPLLWLVALAERPALLGVGVAVSASTDVLDGFLARRMGRTTDFGSRLDSLADHLLSISLVAWLTIFRPGFLRDQWLPLLVWGMLGVAALLATWRRFGRLGDLHLHSAKLAGTVGYLFGIHLLIFGTYSRPAFYLVLAAVVAAALETLVTALRRPRADEDPHPPIGAPPGRDAG